MQVGLLSSVYRETKNARLAVEYVIDSLGCTNLAGSMVMYTGDCFPAIQDLLKMTGSVDVFPEKKRLHVLAAEHDVHVDFAWKPETHEWLQYADELSRIPVNSDILLRHKQFDLICK